MRSSTSGQTAPARTALLVGAHPPGRGSGTGLRALVSLTALRSCCERVDAVSLESPGEARWADPETHRIPRRPDPPLPTRIAALRYGGAYYAAARSVGLLERLRELVAEGVLLHRYDIVLACQSLTARAAYAAVDARARLLDIDNVAAGELRRSAADPRASRAKRAFRRLGSVALAHEERARCNLSDAVTVPSELERERLGPVETEVIVVPNTVSAAEPVVPSRAGARILFMGSLDYEPNADGLRWLVTEILPLVRTQVGEARLTVLGRNPPPELDLLCRAHDVDLVVDAPDLEPHHASSRVMIAPLRLGGGTRFKILDGLARGEAIVATPTAAEGLRVRDGRDLRLAESPDDLAAACVDLLRDGAAADRLGAAAYETWAAHYRPELATAQLVELVERLAPRPAG